MINRILKSVFPINDIKKSSYPVIRTVKTPLEHVSLQLKPPESSGGADRSVSECSRLGIQQGILAGTEIEYIKKIILPETRYLVTRKEVLDTTNASYIYKRQLLILSHTGGRDFEVIAHLNRRTRLVILVHCTNRFLIMHY